MAIAPLLNTIVSMPILFLTAVSMYAYHADGGVSRDTDAQLVGLGQLGTHRNSQTVAELS